MDEDLIISLIEEVKQLKTQQMKAEFVCGICHNFGHVSSDCRLATRYGYGERVEWDMGPQNEYQEWEDRSYDPRIYNYESYDYSNNSWTSHEDQSYQPNESTLEDTLKAFMKLADESEQKVRINEEKRIEECLSSFMLSSIEAQERTNRRFNSIEASYKRMESQLERIANEFQRRQLEEQNAYEVSVICKMVEEGDEEQRIEYKSELEVKDDTICLPITSLESFEPLDPIQSYLPMIVSVQELQESFDPILVKIPLKNENPGSVAPFSSSLFLPVNECYIIEFEDVCETCYWVSMDDLEALGHGSKELKWKLKNIGKDGPDNFPFNPG